MPRTPRAKARKPQAKPVRARGEGRKVLIVEDQASLRQLYQQILKQGGFRVALSGDGKDAVEMAADLRPDVIVMDMAMPRMGGMEALRVLKQSADTKDIPVVLITAFSPLLEQRQLVAKLGAAACLSKIEFGDNPVRTIEAILHLSKKQGEPERRRARKAGAGSE